MRGEEEREGDKRGRGEEVERESGWRWRRPKRERAREGSSSNTFRIRPSVDALAIVALLFGNKSEIKENKKQKTR